MPHCCLPSRKGLVFLLNLHIALFGTLQLLDVVGVCFFIDFLAVSLILIVKIFMAKTDNSNMKRAKDNKNDEFYTRMSDIEKEIPNYDLNGMVVYCCCDDYRWSNFVKYFKEHFEETGISKLIATNYDNGDGAWKYEYDGYNETVSRLHGNGDFMSDECTRIKNDEADIVITNPPFSLFKQFVKWLYD